MNSLVHTLTFSACCALFATLGCSEPASDTESSSAAAHDNASLDDHAEDSDHVETPLGTTMIGDLEVQCAQGHGETAPGREMHLVVKLPYNDNGATVVRAWIGVEDRLDSLVALGEYAPSHDDYDIHAEASDPLQADAAWWIEVEKPDGSKQIGSIAFL